MLTWTRLRPHIRVADADREDAVRVLHACAAEGRLTPDELDERVGRAYQAVIAQDLQTLVADLPGPAAAPRHRPPHPAVPLAAAGALLAVLPGVLGLVLVLTLVCLAVAAVVTVVAVGLAFAPVLAIAAVIVAVTRGGHAPWPCVPRRHRRTPARFL